MLNVSSEDTAKNQWDKLRSLYQSKSLVRKLFLRKKLYLLRMEEADSVTENINAFNIVISQLVSVNIDVTKEEMCVSMLCSFPNSWDGLVVVVRSNNTTLSIDDVVATLLSEDMHQKNTKGSTHNALMVRGRPIDRGELKSYGKKSKSRGKLKSRSKTPNKSRRICWGCGKPGHYKRDYMSTDSKERSEEVKSTESKATHEKGDVYLASTITQSHRESWLIDSSASYHMMPHREWFCEYERFNGGNVLLGDDLPTRIVGQGKVRLIMHDGRKQTLPGVSHILGLARNLVSVRKMGGCRSVDYIQK